jgi:hypothetical protein
LEWTTKERDEKCISIQEAIYGTKLLKELERIKMEIDPNFMMDCYGCILNNRDRSNDPLCDDGVENVVNDVNGNGAGINNATDCTDPPCALLDDGEAVNATVLVNAVDPSGRQPDTGGCSQVKNWIALATGSFMAIWLL